MCNIHPEFKLKNFCLTCRRAICQICENELHNQHNIENARSAISKEEADKMLQLLKEKIKTILIKKRINIMNQIHHFLVIKI